MILKRNNLISGKCFISLLLLVLVFITNTYNGRTQTKTCVQVCSNDSITFQPTQLSEQQGLTYGTDQIDFSYDEYSLNTLPQSSNTELGKSAFAINLGGLLFFGPTFRFEFRVGSSAVMDAHIRWAFAGVLFQAIITDFWSEDATVLPYSIGVGAGFKALLGNSSRPHRFYVGSVVEYNFGGSTNDYGKEERNHALVFGGDLGMRWRSETGFMFSIGIQPAVAFVIKDGYYYDEDPDVWHDYGFSVRPAPILELSIGWEFGK